MSKHKITHAPSGHIDCFRNYFIVFALENLHYLYIEKQSWNMNEVESTSTATNPHMKWTVQQPSSHIAYKCSKYIVAPLILANFQIQIKLKAMLNVL